MHVYPFAYTLAICVKISPREDLSKFETVTLILMILATGRTHEGIKSWPAELLRFGTINSYNYYISGTFIALNNKSRYSVLQYHSMCHI